MKKLFTSIILGLSLIAAPVMFTACQTAGKTLATTVQTVDGAMQGWAMWVALGKSTPAQEAQVKLAYEKYQAAESIAKNAILDGIKTGNQSGWAAVSAALTNSRTELINLINSFTQTQP